eukprot:1187326-Prorocentrum_minimum.AAC.2
MKRRLVCIAASPGGRDRNVGSTDCGAVMKPATSLQRFLRGRSGCAGQPCTPFTIEYSLEAVWTSTSITLEFRRFPSGRGGGKSHLVGWDPNPPSGGRSGDWGGDRLWLMRKDDPMLTFILFDEFWRKMSWLKNRAILSGVPTSCQTLNLFRRTTGLKQVRLNYRLYSI